MEMIELGNGMEVSSETYQAKIKELRAEIARIEEVEQQAFTEKYKYLIGKCLKRAYSSRELITNVLNAYEEYGDVYVDLEVMTIYYHPSDPDGKLGDNDGMRISSQESIFDLNLKDLEKYHMCEKEDFDKFFNDCVECMRKKINLYN